MKASDEFVRQSARFTMNGLIDPRLLPGYNTDRKNAPASSITLLTILQKAIENSKKANGHAPVWIRI